MSARTRVPLQPGQALTLRVAALHPQPVLQVEHQRTASAELVLDKAMARSLPVQGSSTDTRDLLRHLQAHLRQATMTSGTAATPAQRRSALTRDASSLLASVPNADSLTRPETLRHTVLNALRSPEARLTTAVARTEPLPADADYGTALRRVARRLLTTTEALPPGPPKASKPPPATPAHAQTIGQGTGVVVTERTPPSPSPPPTGPVARPETEQTPASTETARNLRVLGEAAVARQQTQYVQTAQIVNGTGHALHADLPVRQQDRVDVWQLQVEQDTGTGTAGSDPEQRTQLTLEFQVDADVRVRTRIVACGNTLHVCLDSDEAELTAAFASHRQELARRLDVAGLDVAHIQIVPLKLAQGPVSRERPFVEDSI